MAEDWDAIAREVAGALSQVGFVVTLEKPATVPTTPWDTATATFTTSELTCVDDRYRLRDQAGNLLQQSMRTLTVNATDAVPAKKDRVRVNGEWFEIAEVRPTAPGGVAVLYELDLLT